MAREDDIKTIKHAALMFLLLVLGMLWVPAAVVLDVVVLKNGMPEFGVTEISQELFIFVSLLLMFILAVRLPQQRGFLLLVASFFLCMLIRELDYLFDLIQHGFWKYPVILVIVISFLLACIFRSSILPAMADATRSYPFAYILAGLAVDLFLSRVFGTGSLWSAILETNAGIDAPAIVKNSVQEGVELLGCVLLLFGTVMFARLHWQADKPFTD